jgi:hypothetical protein
MNGQLRNIWFDAEGTRFFLLPDDLESPPGELEVFNHDGDTRSIDPAALAAYAIAPEEADEIIRRALEPVADQVEEAVRGATEQLLAAAPGVAAVSSGPAQVGDDPAVALGRLLQLDPDAIRARPELASEELSRLLERLEEVGKGLGVLAPRPTAKEPPPAPPLAADADDEDPLRRVQRDAQTLLERIGVWLAQHLPERQRDLGDVKGLRDLLYWALDAPPTEETEEQRQARYRADVRAEIDSSFEGFRLPSLTFEDLLRKTPRAAEGGTVDGDEKDGPG